MEGLGALVNVEGDPLSYHDKGTILLTIGPYYGS